MIDFIKELKVFLLLLTILIIITSIFLFGSPPADDDLSDMICSNCNGIYKYEKTESGYGNTTYWYKCNTCGKRLYTNKWRGK